MQSFQFEKQERLSAGGHVPVDCHQLMQPDVTTKRYLRARSPDGNESLGTLQVQLQSMLLAMLFDQHNHGCEAHALDATVHLQVDR